MNWLSARRTRRRKQQAGASFLAFGLIAGVLGIAPAFADPSDGVRCWAEHHSDGSLTFSWSGVEAADVDDVWVSWWSSPDAAAASFSQRVPADLQGTSGQWTMPTDPYPAHPHLAIWWDDERDDQLCSEGSMPGDLQTPTFAAKCASGFLEVSVGNQGTAVTASITTESETAPGTWTTVAEETLAVPGFSAASYGAGVDTISFPFRMRIVGDDDGNGSAEIDETFTWLYDPCSPDWATPTVAVSCADGTVVLETANNGAPGDVGIEWTDADGIAGDRSWVDVPNAQTVEHTWRLDSISLPLTVTITAGGAAADQLMIGTDAANCAATFEISDPSVTCEVSAPSRTFTVTNVSAYDGSYTYEGADRALAAGASEIIEVSGASTVVTISWTDDLGGVQERSWDFAPMINDQCNGDLEVTSVPDCAADTVAVTIAATGGEVTLAWEVDNGGATTVQMRPGGADELTVELPAGSVLSLVANGEPLAPIDSGALLDSSCFVELTADLTTPDCVAGTVAITVTNTGTVEATVEITYGNSTTSDLIAADDSTVLDNLQPGLPLSIVDADNGDVILERSDLDDVFAECEPDIDWEFTPVCAADTLAITATNNGDVDVAVAVVVGAQAPVSVTIPANAVDHLVDLAVALDDSVEIWSGADVLASFTQLEPCPFDIDVDIAVDCASDTALVEFHNRAPRAVTLHAINANLLSDPLFDVSMEPMSTTSYTWDLAGLPEGAGSVDVIIDTTGELVDQLTWEEAFFCVTAVADLWVDVAADCASISDGTVGAVRVTVGNDGVVAGDVTIAVAVSDDAPVNATIAAGSPGEVFVFTADLGQQVLVSVVDADGSVIDSRNFDPGCVDAAPELTGWVECTATRIRGAWTNNGNAPGAVAITVDGSIIETWDLAPGATQPYDADRLDSPFDGDHTVAIVAGDNGATLASIVISDAICGHTVGSFHGSLTAVCDSAQSIVASVTNDTDHDDVVTLTINGVAETLGPIAAGTSVTFHIDQPLGAEVHAALSHADTNLASVSWETFCTEAAPDIEVVVHVDCGTEELVIELRNVGEAAGTVDVSVDGVALATVDVAAGETRFVNHGPIDPGQDYLVEVTGADPVASEVVETSQCVDRTPDITASTAVDCAASEVQILMKNLGAAAGSVTWSVNGVDSSALLQPGETRLATTPITLGAAIDIVITTDLGVLHTHREADLCSTEGPDLAASTDLVCESSSLVVTISNTGRASGVVELQIGDAVRTVAVPALGSIEEVFELTEDQRISVIITTDAGDETLLSETRTLNCSGPSGAAEIALDCTAFLLSYVLTNNGAEAQEFVVKSAGNPNIVVEVEPGATHKGFLAVEEGDSYNVLVESGSETLAASASTVNCVETQVLMAQGKLARTGVNTASLVVAATTLVVAGAFFTSAGRDRSSREPATI